MRKKKKGFTLIELLAIIVILAIIAVITVPIILNIIENSKKGAAQDSAYGFKDAVNKAYVTKLSGDSDYNITDGTYTVSDLKTQIGLSVSGKEPASNSWVTITKNNVTTGCLQYDDYAVLISDGKVGEVTKSICDEMITNTLASITNFAIFPEKEDTTFKTISNLETDLSVGDYVIIGDEAFYVIGVPQSTTSGIPTYNKVVLISEYNLGPQGNGPYYFDSLYTQKSGNYYLTYGFTDWQDYYWENCLGTLSNGCTKVYTKLYPSEEYYYVYDSNSQLYTYLENYKTYLETTTGTGKILNIRLMSHLESGLVKDYDWAHNQNYWLGSAYDNTYIWEIDWTQSNCSNTWCLNTRSGEYYDSEGTGGVRPVIEISSSDFFAWSQNQNLDEEYDSETP